MSDIMSTAGDLFSGFDLGGLWSGIGILILVVIICGLLGFAVYFFLTRKRFNKTVTFFKKNPSTGKYYPFASIKAMPIRFTKQGDIVYRLQKPFETRNVLERLTIEVSPGKHWVAYGIDGKIVELEGISDIDKERKEAMVNFIDPNTELSRSAMLEMSRERYEKPSFWEKHGALIINIGAIAVIMVFLYLISGKLIELVGSIGSLLDRSEELLTAQSNILDSLNNLMKSRNI